MLEHFFAEKSDPKRSPLAQKLHDTLDAHFDGPLSLEDLLQLLHAECVIVKDSFAEAPEGKAGQHFSQALRHYMDALLLVARELESTGELRDETETAACALAAQADQLFSDFEFEASQEPDTEG